MTSKSHLTHRFGSLACLLAALTAVVLAGCTPDVSEIREVGIEQYRNHQYYESMATMRHTLDLSPSDAQANYYMGLNYRVMAERRFLEGDAIGARKRADRAIYYFTQAIESWPNYMAAVSAKNEALEARGKYDKALDVAATVAENNRGIAEHYVYLADEYRQRGDYDNALRNYRVAASIDPELASAYEGMGKLYRTVGDTALAMESFSRAAELDPHNAEVAEQIDQLNAGSDYRQAEYKP
jgi:tetratricopeptide (TPR) repeat protein